MTRDCEIKCLLFALLAVVLVNVFRSDQKYVQQKYTEILEGHLAAIKKRIQVGPSGV